MKKILSRPIVFGLLVFGFSVTSFSPRAAFGADLTDTPPELAAALAQMNDSISGGADTYPVPVLLKYRDRPEVAAAIELHGREFLDRHVGILVVAEASDDATLKEWAKEAIVKEAKQYASRSSMLMKKGQKTTQDLEISIILELSNAMNADTGVNDLWRSARLTHEASADLFAAAIKELNLESRIVPLAQKNAVNPGRFGLAAALMGADLVERLSAGGKTNADRLRLQYAQNRMNAILCDPFFRKLAPLAQAAEATGRPGLLARKRLMQLVSQDHLSPTADDELRVIRAALLNQAADVVELSNKALRENTAKGTAEFERDAQNLMSSQFFEEAAARPYGFTQALLNKLSAMASDSDLREFIRQPAATESPLYPHEALNAADLSHLDATKGSPAYLAQRCVMGAQASSILASRPRSSIFQSVAGAPVETSGPTLSAATSQGGGHAIAGSAAGGATK